MQLAPGASPAPIGQVVAEMAKLPLGKNDVTVGLMAVNVTVLDIFLSVAIIAALVVFTTVFGNCMKVGVKTAICGVPVPVSITFTGFVVIFPVICKVAVRVPVAVGSKVTPIVQLVPALSGVSNSQVPSPFAEKSAGSAPAVPGKFKPTGFVPVTFTVTNCSALVLPTSWLPNVKPVGLTVIVPSVGGVLVAPVPLSVKDCVPLDSVMVTVAVSVPVVEGVNVTVNVQTIVGGTVAPQVLKSLKSAASGPLTAMLLISSAFVPFASVTTSVLDVPV